MALSEQANLLIRISATNAAGATLTQMNQQFGQLQSTVLRVAAAIGSAFALRDVLDTTRRFTHDLDALRDAIGASGAEASAWNFQARYVGITADDLASSFQILANNVYSQADAMAKGTSDFDKLGVSVLNTQGQMKPFGQILEGLREKMRKLDAPSQAIIERQLFGRAGGRLHDFLTLAVSDIRRLDEIMTALGADMSGGLMNAMEKQQRELNLINYAWDGLKVRIGNYIIPIMIRLFRDVLPRVQQGLKALGDALRVPLEILKTVIDKVGKFSEWLKGNSNAAALLRTALVALIGLAVAAWFLGIVTQVLRLVAAFAPLLVAVAAFALGMKAAETIAHDNTFGQIATGIDAAAAAMGLFLARINPVLSIVLSITAALGQVVLTTQLVTDKWEDWRRAAHDGLLENQGLVGTFIKGLVAFGDDFSNLGALMRGVFDDIGSTAMVVFGTISAFIGMVADRLQNVFDWLVTVAAQMANMPLLGGIIQFLGLLGGGGGGGVPQFPPSFLGGGSGSGGGPLGMLIATDTTGGQLWQRPDGSQHYIASGDTRAFAHGGIVTGPTRALIGEAGPEAVVPLDRLGSGGMGVTIGSIIINGSVDSRERVRELAREVSGEIMRLTRSQRNFAF